MATSPLVLFACLMSVNVLLGSASVMEKDALKLFIDSTEHLSTTIDFYEEYEKAKKEVRIQGYAAFDCPQVDVAPPKDVHSLSPKYVSVMAALGDSLTAANGAKAYTLPGVALQYRGVSFSIGGDGTLNDTLTLPNIIRRYSPKLFGPSKHVTTVGFEEWSQLNVGIPGSTSADMLSQADMLVKRIGKKSQYKDDWKVVTMFVGANDICGCDSTQDPDVLVSSWTAQVSKALDILAANLKNTFVNLVNAVDVPAIRTYDYYPYCGMTHGVYCPCNGKDPNRTDLVTRKYQQAMYNVPKQYEGRSDFTVVLQPFSERIVVPYVQKDNKTEPDLSLLAPDCFHFSRWGHATAASALWNSMLLPLQSKTNYVDPNNVQLQCLDPACPYFRTSVNSVTCSIASKE